MTFSRLQTSNEGIPGWKSLSLGVCLTLLPGMVFPMPAWAAPAVEVTQQSATTLKGVVIDEAGQPVVGANVVQVGTTNGTITDLEGKFVLKVPSNAMVEISFIGYVTKSLPATRATRVVLVEDTETLDEVVVTALGIKRDEKALGYALQEVKGEALLTNKSPNVTDALSGKISGLQVVKGGGGVGGSSKIILRGQSSLTGDNQPLIVIDGVPMDNTASGNTDVWGNSGMDMGNGLQDINPDDIESMSVLKGASAAALYGSRAGNGVILITTKSGKAQEGLGITVNAGLTIEDIFITPKLQNDFGQGYDGVFNPVETSSWGPALADRPTVTNWAGKQEQLQAYDNVGNFFRTGIQDNEGVTFQQQIGKTSVYAAVNHSNTSSIVPETSLNRTSLVARATTNLGRTDRWKLDFKVNYVNTNTYNRPIQGINQNNTFRTIYGIPRSLDITQFDPCIVDGKQIWFDTQTLPQDNPYWNLQYNQNYDKRNRFIGFMSLNYKITDWLSAEIKGGTDYYNTKMYHKKYSGSLASPKNGIYEEGLKEFQENNYSFLLIAQKDNFLKNLSGTLTFGGNMMNQNISETHASSGELLIENLFSLNNGKEKPTITSTPQQRKMNSLYGSLQLGWRNALFLDVTARNDWSSTMSKQNRSYFYPSVSLSGVLSELVKLPDWFTFAKVRASFAEVGNDLQPYQLYNSYTVSKDYWGTPTVSPNTTLYDADVMSELIKSWEAGLDLRFFQGRLRLDFAWYKSNATKQLLKLPMNETSGYTTKMVNAGNIQNSGVELTVSGDIFQNPKGFSWTSSLNFSKNNNKIVSLYEGVSTYEIATVDEIRVVAEVGQPYGNMYGSVLRRVEDEKSPYFGKLVLTSEGLPQRGENTTAYLGNQQPDFMLSFTNGLSYKNLSLDFQVDARVGGEMFSMTRSSLNASGLSAETVVNGKRENMVVDGVILQDDGSYVVNTKEVTPQRYWTALGQGNIGIAEANIYDATNVRLRTLSLGYTLPKKWLAKTPLQRVKVGFTANNLWMIYTGVPGIDPESVSGTGTNATGLELAVPPTSRSFTFNVSVGF